MYDNYCHECKWYGDDYILNYNGEWKSVCDDCPYNETTRVMAKRECIEYDRYSLLRHLEQIE